MYKELSESLMKCGISDDGGNDFGDGNDDGDDFNDCDDGGDDPLFIMVMTIVVGMITDGGDDFDYMVVTFVDGSGDMMIVTNWLLYCIFIIYLLFYLFIYLFIYSSIYLLCCLFIYLLFIYYFIYSFIHLILY